MFWCKGVDVINTFRAGREALGVSGYLLEMIKMYDDNYLYTF